MTLQRWAARRDGTESAIVRTLRRAGALVFALKGRGVADLLVYFRGRLFLLEIKTARGRLTAAQRDAVRVGWPVRVCRTPDDALRAIGIHAIDCDMDADCLCGVQL